MAGELSARERLRLAGLDLDLPLGPAADDSARYCPYTGRERLLTVSDAGGDDSARLGTDGFTKRGRILRYRPGGGSAEVVEQATVGGSWRGTVDLLASSGSPWPDEAIRRGVDEAPAERWALVAPGLATLREVAARHGRLYALSSTGPQQHLLQAWKLPTGAVAEGWRPQRLRGTLVAAEGHRPPSRLSVSETLVYVNFGEYLAAWHAGTGEYLLEWPWPPSTGLPVVQIAGDRVLVAREEGAAQIAEVYDLAALAAGPCRPLAGQSLRLGEAPQHDAQPLWAAAAGDRFVVLGAEGQVVVFPFDGEPFVTFPNVEGVRLGSPSLLGQPDGSLALASYVSHERGRWLLVAPLDPTQSYRFEPLADRPPVSSELAPVQAGGAWIGADVGPEANLQVSRAASVGGRADKVVEVPGTGGARLEALQRVFSRGFEAVWVMYGPTTRKHWVVTAALERLTVEPPFPQLRPTSEVRLLWDAGGLYLCDLTDGIVYPRRLEP